MKPRQVFLKLSIDIFTGIFGGMSFYLCSTNDYISSTEWIVFTQECVGWNGKVIKIYMYMATEDKKTELMKQNKNIEWTSV